MIWLQVGLAIVGVLLLICLGAWIWFYRFIDKTFFNHILRIFQEKPLFFAPRGEVVPEAERVTFETEDGWKLVGSYLKGMGKERRGVIVFGTEFGSNRWACIPYCHFLREAGFDIFTFDFRCQGESEQRDSYEPLHWVTAYEVQDVKAALKYVRSRPDADAKGVGFFGISRGGGAGVAAACGDPYVSCMVTDGCFSTYSTMLPFMRKWLKIYSQREWIQKIMPDWYYLMFARKALRHTEKQRKCHFINLEKVIGGIAPRPFLMIHGEKDNYIKPEATDFLFSRAGDPKELWYVPGAKHNQAVQVQPEEYKKRVLEFFSRHLSSAGEKTPCDSFSVPLRRKGTPVTAKS